jgi:polysaccharide pyruvyl transferase WcaK-like protein
MTNVYFINDTSDSPNWGCRATTRALREMVEEYGGQITDTLYLARMSAYERYPARKGVRAVEQRVEQLLPSSPRWVRVRKRLARPIQATPPGRLWNRIAAASDTVPDTVADFAPYARRVMGGEILQEEYQALEACDMVVINGEGSIYDRQRKGRMMLFLAYLSKTSFNKPCIMVNHTADIHDPVMRDMVAHVYPMLDDVVFREPLSAEACAPYCEKHTDTLSADAAFRYTVTDKDSWTAAVSRPGYFDVWPDVAQPFDPSRPYVCVGGSSIYLRADRPAYDPIPGFIRLCTLLKQEFGQVVLTAPDWTDQRIFRPVAEALGMPLIGLYTPTLQVVDILGHAQAYISGRWHPSILASVGGTPIVTLTANTYKTQALVRQMHLPEETFDALKIHETAADIVALTRCLVQEGDKQRERIRNRAQELARLSLRNVRLLKNVT